MPENEIDGSVPCAAEPQGAEAEKTEAEAAPADGGRANRNAFENFYEHFRNVPVKYLDRFIALCIFALVAVITVGILRAKGVF